MSSSLDSHTPPKNVFRDSKHFLKKCWKSREYVRENYRNILMFNHLEGGLRSGEIVLYSFHTTNDIIGVLGDLTFP